MAIKGRVFDSGALPASRAYREYAGWVAQGSIADPRAIISRARVAIASRFPERVRKYTLIEEGQVGRITPIRCLDALLFSELASRVNLREVPAEFGSYVLERSEADGRRFVKVYFLSSLSPMGAPASEEVENDLSKDIAEGWSVLAGFHNHPFSGDLQLGGELVPSEADLDQYALDVQRFRMREAWITNGLHTVVFRASELERLRPAR